MKVITHKWEITCEEARRLQEELRERVILTPPKKRFRYIGGADVSYEKHGDKFYSGIVVWDMERREVIEKASATKRVNFPYVPGLLSFREAPAILDAFYELRSAVDVLIIDGQGIAHPRELGLASHVSLLLGIPGIGCAKTKLVGEHKPVGVKRGSHSALIFGGKCVGAVLRTQDNVKPLYVSPGHKMNVHRAVDIVLKCALTYRLPEPTRLAHQFVNQLRSADK